MPRGKFDCFLVYAEIGSDQKLARLTVEERWAFVAGVLAIAHSASPRGHLMIADGIRAEAPDVAAKARVSEEVAQSCLDKLAELRVVRPLKGDGDPQDRVWLVVNFAAYNPDPSPSNTREAWRDRKRAQRQRDRGPGYVGATDMRKVRAEQAEALAREEQLQLGKRGSGIRRAS